MKSFIKKNSSLPFIPSFIRRYSRIFCIGILSLHIHCESRQIFIFERYKVERIFSLLIYPGDCPLLRHLISSFGDVFFVLSYLLSLSLEKKFNLPLTLLLNNTDKFLINKEPIDRNFLSERI